MLDKLKEWDQSLLLYLNSFHLDPIDPIMYQLTQTLPWVPMYLFLSFLVWKVYGKQCWWVFLAIGLTIFFADKTASGIFKPYFERLRPCHDPNLQGIVYNFRHCGGMYGFVSSHASTSFSVATIMTLVLGASYPAVRWLFLWAAFFSFTRIYLGVHFPGDVLGGAIIGILSAWIAYKFMFWVKNKITPNSLL
jgi:undecaprenyl-diphosphatase